MAHEIRTPVNAVIEPMANLAPGHTAATGKQSQMPHDTPPTLGVAAPALRPALSVPGLTMSRALMYLPGSDQVFERVLRQFGNQYQHGIAGLMPVLAVGNWQQVGRRLHSLRGACGAIGATELLARAGALEEALDLLMPDGDSSAVELPDVGALAAGVGQLNHDVMALVSAIRAQLDPLPIAPARLPPAVDRRALQLAMEALAGQLGGAESGALAGFRALAPHLTAAFGAAAVQPAADALARQDFDGARLALQGLAHAATTALPGSSDGGLARRL